MVIPGRRTVWDGVIELTKMAQENCLDPRLWAYQLSSNLKFVVEFPSTELAEVLVSYICWDNNVPILWKFLERAMALKLVSPLVVLALLADRVFPSRSTELAAYRIYLELLKRNMFTIKDHISGPHYENVMISVANILRLSELFDKETSEPGVLLVEFVFKMVSQLLEYCSPLIKNFFSETSSQSTFSKRARAKSTCKKWNESLRFDGSFTKKHIGEANAAAKNKQRKEFQVVMMLSYRVYLFSVNLRYPSIERVGKRISLNDADRVDISKIFHCDGLLLCVTKDISRLVVWNPCSGQTRCIEPRTSYHSLDRYALGYELNNDDSLRSHKILRFMDGYDYTVKHSIRAFEIYNLTSNSWKVVDGVNPHLYIEYFHHGVSLKGKTYWCPRAYNLLCSDFTTERFGPSLPLPFCGYYKDVVTLSSVGETQLAVLYQKCGSPALTVEIWITTKIESNAVSWSKFLTVDMQPLTGFEFLYKGGSFFVDEKEKVAVVLDKDRDKFRPTRNIAYIIGKMGYFKQVDLGESRNGRCCPLLCSYVPSAVQIKQPAP